LGDRSKFAIIAILASVYKFANPSAILRFLKYIGVLLEAEDTELFQWFLGKGVPDDPDNAKIVKIVLANTGLQVEPKA